MQVLKYSLDKDSISYNVIIADRFGKDNMHT